MNSIFDELRKISIIKMVLVLMLVLILGNFIIGLLYNDNRYESLQLLEEEKEDYIDMKNTIGDNDDGLNINEMCDKKIAILDYSIDNGITYQQLSIVSNLEKNSLLIDFIIIILIYISYSIINIEDECGTWKNIYILNKADCKRIVLKKKMAEYASVLLSVFLLYAIAFLFGILMYGDWNNIKLEYVNGIVIERNYNNELVNMMSNVLFRAFFYSEETFCLACILKKGKMALLIPILIVIFENNIGHFLEMIKIDMIFPIKYIQIFREVTSNTTKEIIMAITYIVITTIILNILSITGIKKIKIRS